MSAATGLPGHLLPLWLYLQWLRCMGLQALSNALAAVVHPLNLPAPAPPPRLPPQEPNFHHTYVQLVDRWGERRMRDTLVQTTVHYIKASWGGL